MACATAVVSVANRVGSTMEGRQPLANGRYDLEPEGSRGGRGFEPGCGATASVGPTGDPVRARARRGPPKSDDLKI